MDEKIEWLKQGIASGLLTNDEAVSKAVAMVTSALIGDAPEEKEADTKTETRSRFNWEPYQHLLATNKSNEDIAKELGIDPKKVASKRHNDKKKNANK